ncbi:tRNA methyltransferase [Maribacter phage Panino]
MEENGSLDSSDQKVEDGSLESAESQTSLGSDIWNSLKAGTREALAGISGIANLTNKAIFSLVAPDELEEYVNTLSPDERENFINTQLKISGSPISATSQMAILGEEGGEKQEQLNKEAEGIRKKMSQYDTSITEDLGNLDFSKAGRRIAVEGVGVIPSIIQTLIPVVGLPSVGAGAAANKQERLEEEGADVGGKTVVNSVLTGAVESLLEKYTAKQGNKLIKALVGKGDKVIAKGVSGFVDGLKEVGKGGLKEGGTEALQAASENLIDAITTGNEKEAFEIFTEISDSFLVGMAVGAPMKGGEVVANTLIQGVEKKNQPEGASIPLDIPAESENVSGRTQGFFGDVVEGNLEKYKPSKEYEYELEFDDKQASFKDTYDKFKGNFDNHIATSIPTFRDVQVKKGNAIVETVGEGLVYDLGGSEGGFVKTITTQSDGKIRTINVEPNEKMASRHNDNPVEGSEVVQQAFQEGFDNIEAFQPTEKADLVHESMLFQFMSKDRKSKIKEVKDKYLKNDGLFVTEQKFQLFDKEQQQANENIKDSKHKSKYFTDEQIKQKGESVLVGMSENQANFDEYIMDLNSEFEYVGTYWKAGNFRGIVATNDKGKFDTFMEKVGNTENNYNSQPTDNQEVTTDDNATSVKKLFTGRKTKIEDFSKTKGEFIFLSEDKNVAESYGEVTEVEVDTSNFFDLTSQDKKNEYTRSFTDIEIVDIFNLEESASYWYEKPLNNKPYDDILKELISTKRQDIKKERFSGDGEVQNKFLRKIKAEGYDGVLLEDSFFGRTDISYVVFNKEIIKNTTNISDIETTATNTINEGRNSGLKDADIIESIENKDEKRTAEIILQREKDQNLKPEEAAKKSKELAEKSREEQSRPDNQNLTAVERAANSAADMYVDRQASVKNIMKGAGLESTTDFMVAKLGASSYAKHIVTEAHKKTFDGLKTKDVKTLEEIILLRNIISTDKNRKKLGKAPVKHQGGLTNIAAEKALEGYKSEMGEVKFNEFMKKADAYFDVNKKMLKDMKDEGLISEESYEAVKDREYQSTVYLDFMKDMDDNFLTEELDNFETSSLSTAQLKTMKGGWEGSQSMDSQTLQQKSLLTKTKAVFNNRMNKAFANELKPALKELAELNGKTDLTLKEEKRLRYLKELDSKVKMDKIVGFTEPTDGSFGKPKYALEKANTKGYKPIYYYENGVANRIFIKEEFYNKFTDTSNQILNANGRENMSKLSGTRLVKTLATGENPLFFITNIPRDLAFALAFSKEYGSGYKTVVPVEMAKLIMDFGRGIGQSLSKGSSYQKYIEYGGGMDFLTIQGRYGKQGIFNRYMENKVAEKLVDVKQTAGVRGIEWLRNGMKRFNTASEFATRIAVFDRSIANQLKKMGVKDINSLTKEKQDLVYTKAVRSARELTDFNQGGKATKMLDAGMPYLNAATQGTRAAVENFKARPFESTYRILQITAGFSALGITFAFNYIGVNKDTEDEEIADMTDQEIYFDTLKGVSSYDLRNYYIFPKGRKDSKGNWEYFRVAKAQSLSPFINTSEHFLRKFYSEAHGIEYKQDLGKELMETVNTNVLPIGFNLKNSIGRVPLVDAYVASLGIDAYTGNPLDWKRGKIPAELEGINDERVENFYKELGEAVGYSPVRMKSMLESFITTPSTNPYVGFGYMGAEYITDGSKKDMLKDFKKTSMKRISKSTSQYNEISKALENVSDEIVDVYRKHINVEYEVRKAVQEAKKNDSEDTIEEVLKKVYKDDPDLSEKAVSWAKSELEKKKLNPIVSSLKFERNKEVRALILAERFGDALLKSEDSYSDKEKAILRELLDEKVVDKQVYEYYKKLFK